VPFWKTQIVARLEQNKRYPEEAQSRREQGVAQVFFSIDREGRVLESRVVRSSGSSILDEEALALLERAAPYPPPPAVLGGDHVDLTVPIRFNLTQPVSSN
jgi:protein TonB